MKYMPEWKRLGLTPTTPNGDFQRKTPEKQKSNLPVDRKNQQVVDRKNQQPKSVLETGQNLHGQQVPSFFIKAQQYPKQNNVYKGGDPNKEEIYEEDVGKEEIYEEEIESHPDDSSFDWNDVEGGQFVIFLDGKYLVLDQKNQVEEYIEILCREPPYPEFSLKDISVVQKVEFKFGISLK